MSCRVENLQFMVIGEMPDLPKRGGKTGYREALEGRPKGLSHFHRSGSLLVGYTEETGKNG